MSRHQKDFSLNSNAECDRTTQSVYAPRSPWKRFVPRHMPLGLNEKPAHFDTKAAYKMHDSKYKRPTFTYNTFKKTKTCAERNIINNLLFQLGQSVETPTRLRAGFVNI